MKDIAFGTLAAAQPIKIEDSKSFPPDGGAKSQTGTDESAEGQSTNNDQTSHTQNRKKRERRSKDDNFERNYICGCGKSYLSYAALYTHSKTKHEGMFLEGTTTLNKKKQGRPKKEEWTAQRLNIHYQKSYDFNKEFQHFLEMVPGATELSAEAVPKNLIDDFPVEMFVRQGCYEKLLLDIEQLKNELAEQYGPAFLTQMDIVLFEISNIRSLSCNRVFALFLIYTFRFVSKAFYRELVFFCVAYQRMMNKVGWDKVREMRDVFSGDTSLEFCSEQDAEFMPDFCNEFMMEHFAEAVTGGAIIKSSSELAFLGLDPISLLRTILLIKHFCSWLSKHNFSRAKIEIQKE